MKKMLWLFVLLLSQAAFSGDLFVNNQPRLFNLADPLELGATIGGYPIWQGEQKWRIYDLARSDSTGGSTTVPIGKAGLFQTEGGKFVAVMTMTSNLSGGYALVGRALQT